MHVLHTIQAMRHERAQWSGPVGLVPTMGYLHQGHLSLLREARRENEHCVASIFVNPTQFGINEDLSTYPSNIERDLALLETAGIDSVFIPTANEMYPQGFATYVEPGGTLSEQSEGASRPGHFRGVATVVLKLFQIMQPEHAYFGQKDAQQAAVIRRMVQDFNLPVTLRILPTIRESDGLAMSSRNSYLDETSRQAARSLYQALLLGKEVFDRRPDAGIAAVIDRMTRRLSQETAAHIEYVEVRDPQTFLPLTKIQAPALLLLAARIGSARLIDNFLLQENGDWNTGYMLTEQQAHMQ